jgi:glycosyltransferase involved in cell wall biosynthesis
VSEPHVACVVPALNAAPALEAVVAGLRASLGRTLVTVIDDGSADETYRVARRCADVVERFPTNKGKGAALRAGFAVALEQHADVVLTIDADGQHDPSFAPALVRALKSADIAIGARDPQSTAMPRGRRLTNRLSAAVMSRCIGRPVADAQSGFRAIASRVVREVTPRGNRYEFETEFLIVAARRGHCITFVPVPTVYHSPVPSQFRPLRDSARIVGTLWRFGIGDHG